MKTPQNLLNEYRRYLEVILLQRWLVFLSLNTQNEEQGLLEEDRKVILKF